MHIAVLALGNPKYAQASREVLSNYFYRHELKHTFITDDVLKSSKIKNIKYVHPSWLKLLMHDILEKEDFILNWDLDLLPIPDAPNIKNELNYNFVNMVEDTSILYGYDGFNENFKYNCGLIGIPSKLFGWSKFIFDHHHGGDYPSYEQYYFNDQLVIDNINVHVLHPSFNTLYPKNRNGMTLWSESVFRHYTFGIEGDKKVDAIIEHAERYFECLK